MFAFLAWLRASRVERKLDRAVGRQAPPAPVWLALKGFVAVWLLIGILKEFVGL